MFRRTCVRIAVSYPVHTECQSPGSDRTEWEHRHTLLLKGTLEVSLQLLIKLKHILPDAPEVAIFGPFQKELRTYLIAYHPKILPAQGCLQ